MSVRIDIHVSQMHAGTAAASGEYLEGCGPRGDLILRSCLVSVAAAASISLYALGPGLSPWGTTAHAAVIEPMVAVSLREEEVVGRLASEAEDKLLEVILRVDAPPIVTPSNP